MGAIGMNLCVSLFSGMRMYDEWVTVVRICLYIFTLSNTRVDWTLFIIIRNLYDLLFYLYLDLLSYLYCSSTANS